MNAALTEDEFTAVTERIAGGPAAAARAREMLSEALADSITGEAMHDVLLLTTELITNAVRHADVDEGRTLELTVHNEPRRLRVAVTDPGGATTPQVQSLDVSVPGGMGLFLVEQISSRWGAERAAGGATQVWFELAR
jgi:anti-sigma regulatory factor (Ser/Thr protein kinase)